MSVFISYDTREVAWADFLKAAIDSRFPHVKAFVALRDIRQGEDPLKRMLTDELSNADAVIPICSRASQSSPWIWWETSATWVRGKPVLPLFIDIGGNEFGAPLSVVRQGRDFDVEGVENSIRELVSAFGGVFEPLSTTELNALSVLVAAKNSSPLHVDINGPSCIHAEPRLAYRRIRVTNLGKRTVRSARVELTAFEPQGATFLPVLLQRTHGLPHPFDINPGEEIYIDIVAWFDGTPDLLYLCYDRASHPSLPNSVEVREYELSLAVSALDIPRVQLHLVINGDRLGNLALTEA